MAPDDNNTLRSNPRTRMASARNAGHAEVKSILFAQLSVFFSLSVVEIYQSIQSAYNAVVYL